MNKTISSILLKQTFWTFLISSILLSLILLIFFGSLTNKWFTESDVIALNLLSLIFNLCLTLASLTTLFNLSVKVRSNKVYYFLSYFLFPLSLAIILLLKMLKLKQDNSDSSDAPDVRTFYISYCIVLITFLGSHTYYYLKFRQS